MVFFKNPEKLNKSKISGESFSLNQLTPPLHHFVPTE
jgi:hypothetical protein